MRKKTIRTNKDRGVLFKLFAEGETNTVSSKRVIAVFSFIALIILSFLSAFGNSTDVNFIYIFGVLSGGQSCLTTIEKIMKRKESYSDC